MSNGNVKIKYGHVLPRKLCSLIKATQLLNSCVRLVIRCFSKKSMLQNVRLYNKKRSSMTQIGGYKCFLGVWKSVNHLPHSPDQSPCNFPVSILYKSTAGRYRPVSYPDGPITARCRFIKNASWVSYSSNTCKHTFMEGIYCRSKNSLCTIDIKKFDLSAIHV